MPDDLRPKEQAGTESVQKKDWFKWAKGFWFLKGAVAAVTISTLVPKLTSISYLEFLRVFNVLIVAWDQVTRDFAEFLAGFELLGFVNHAMVNTLILASTFVLPGFVFLVRERSEIVKGFTEQVTYSDGIQSPYGPMSMNIAKVSYLALVLSLLITIPLVYTHWNNPKPDGPPVIVLFITSYSFVGALFTLPGFFKGIITALVFVGTLQVLYYFNTPGFTEAINNWACALADARFDDCKKVSP